MGKAPVSFPYVSTSSPGPLTRGDRGRRAPTGRPSSSSQTLPQSPRPPPPPFFNLEDPSILRSTLSSFLFTISEFGSLAKTEIDEQDSNFFFTHKIGVAFFGPGDLGFSDELDSPRSNNFFKLLGPGSRKMGEMEGVGR